MSAVSSALTGRFFTIAPCWLPRRRTRVGADGAEARSDPGPPPQPAAAMYDAESGWSLSFAGCGFLSVYYIGVTHCLSEHAPHFLRQVQKFFGASSGALYCAFFLSGIPLGRSRAPRRDGARAGSKAGSGPCGGKAGVSPKQLRCPVHLFLPGAGEPWKRGVETRGASLPQFPFGARAWRKPPTLLRD